MEIENKSENNNLKLTDKEFENVTGGGYFDDLIQKAKDFKKEMDEKLHPNKEHQ